MLNKQLHYLGAELHLTWLCLAAGSHQAHVGGGFVNVYSARAFRFLVVSHSQMIWLPDNETIHQLQNANKTTRNANTCNLANEHETRRSKDCLVKARGFEQHGVEAQ